MNYERGLFGGAFDPLHLGHVHCILAAASVCRTLYVVLSFSRRRDHIPMEFRYRWLLAVTAHLGNVRVLLLEDDAESKEAYDADVSWERGRDKVLGQIGHPVDVAFCGSDYEGSERYERLYHCPVVYFDRSLLAVSSTRIRENPLACWRWIPEVARPYFVKRVLFLGGESTGKSTLARNLAILYGTRCLPEVGRDVCLAAGGEQTMVEADFHEILVRHKARELDCLKDCDRILFEDTDAVTTLWFSRFLLRDPEEIERTKALAEAIQRINRFDLVFFLEPTVPFVQDGTRNEEIAARRSFYSDQIKGLLDRYGMRYVSLDGGYGERLEKARRIINDTFGIKEVER